MEDNKYDVLNSTPTIPASVYQNLPPFIKECVDQFEDPREKDIMLTGSLVVLSACFSSICGKYNRDWVHPNLFALIVAGAGQGKQIMKYTKNLAASVHDELISNNRAKMEKYKGDLQLWKAKAKVDEEAVGTPPSKPQNSVFFIPGNSSAAAIYKLLDNSNGTGIIFETEIDTVTGAIKQDWGNFSHLLRCGFQHETLSLSRKTDDEYISIEKPRLSVLLSGTPGQVQGLISSAEDGLFSRFLFYCFNRELEWKDQTPCRDCSDLEPHFNRLGHEVHKVKVVLDLGKTTFSLSDAQFAKLNSNFRGKLDAIKAFEGDGAGSVVYRLGLICFRIAMILTTARNMEGLTPEIELECADQDIDVALGLSDTYFEHSMVMYSLLPKQSRREINPRIRRFFSMLPQSAPFARKTANERGASVGIKERSVGKYLDELVEAGMLEKLADHGGTFGHYKKVGDNQ